LLVKSLTDMLYTRSTNMRQHSGVRSQVGAEEAALTEDWLAKVKALQELCGDIGETNSGSDHPNPTQPQSHPAVTPSTELLPS
jgi:hypothetical protein